MLPFLGGFFVDKMSARLMNIVFCGCILVGQFIFAVGVFAGSFPIMIAGRVVFGLGGESLCVGQSALVQQWFCESLNDHPADGGSIHRRAPGACARGCEAERRAEAAAKGKRRPGHGWHAPAHSSRTTATFASAAL